jgi:hypothetical protein
MINSGVMKNTCIKPSAVALPVISKTQIVSANALILVARTDTICPSQTIAKPNIPVGRFVLRIIFLYRLLYTSLIFSEDITGNSQISSSAMHVHMHAALRKSQQDNTSPRVKQPPLRGLFDLQTRGQSM